MENKFTAFVMGLCQATDNHKWKKMAKLDKIALESVLYQKCNQFFPVPGDLYIIFYSAFI